MSETVSSLGEYKSKALKLKGRELFFFEYETLKYVCYPPEGKITEDDRKEIKDYIVSKKLGQDYFNNNFKTLCSDILDDVSESQIDTGDINFDCMEIDVLRIYGDDVVRKQVKHWQYCIDGEDWGELPDCNIDKYFEY